VTIGRALRALLLVGVLTMPFSSGAGEGSVVIAYGLLPLMVLGALLACGLLLRPTLDRPMADAWVTGGLLMAALVITTVYAPRPVESLARSGPGLIGFLAFLFVLSPFYPAPRRGSVTRRRAPRSEETAVLLVGAGTVLAVYFVGNYAYAVATKGLLAVMLDRVTGGAMSLPWGSSNVVASCFLLPIFLTFYTGRSELRPRRRRAMLAARLLMMLGLVATLSRGAIGALVIGLVLHLAIAGRGRRAGLALGLSTLVASGFAVDLVFGGNMTRDLGELAASRLDRSEISQLNNRTDHWIEFGLLIARSPLIGAGYYGSMTVAGGTGHNLVLTTLAERGLLGGLCSVAILVLAAWRAFAGWLTARRSEDRLFFVCLLTGGAAALVHLMVEDANLTHQYIVFSWLALALPLAGHWERVAAPASRSDAGEAPEQAAVPVPVPG
jgi:O-antigen ligase